jgi:hypothetical protein
VVNKLAGRPDLQWAVNKQLLDNAIARGDRFLLATDLVRDPSGFALEIDYRIMRGYQYVTINGATYLQKGQ